MGMVAEKVVWCTESNFQLICDYSRAVGDNRLMWTIPGGCDETIKAFTQKRAEYVVGSMSITKTGFGGKIWETISSE